MNGPSKHLTWNEMACKDGTPYPIEWRINRAIELAEVFELIRKEFGDNPIEVLSAYRSPEHNKKIKGAKKSQHMHGRALDLKPPIGISVDVFCNGIRELRDSGVKINGIGLYKTFVHVDTRPSDSLIFWRGSGAKDS